MRISVRSNIDEVLGFTKALHPQYRFAVAMALTAVVGDVRNELPGDLTRVLDRPTRFTTTGIFITPARKDKLQAVVGIKDKQASYLHWQVAGGSRSPTRRALRLPGAVQTNEYGNLPQGLIRQLIARAQAGRRATKTQARRFGVSQELDLFYGEPDDGRPPGIYKRAGVTTHQLVPLVLFPKRDARYAAKLDLYGFTYRKVSRSISGKLLSAWNYVKSTA